MFGPRFRKPEHGSSNLPGAIMKGWIGLAVAALLAMAGCISLQPEQPPQQAETPTPEPTAMLAGCASYPSLPLRDECYSREAFLKGDPNECEAVVNYSVRDACYRAFASARLNESYCALMKLPENRADCYLGVASARNDSSICMMIEDTDVRRECRVQLRDPTLLCENETTEGAHAACMAKATGDYRPCITLENQSERDWCLHEFAMYSLHPEACGEIIDERVNSECYCDVAARAGNATICALINETVARETCASQFMARPTREVCTLFGNSDRVYSCLAKAEASPHLCELIQDYLVKDKCYEEYAEFALDPFYCSLISTQLYKNPCYENLSIAINDTGLCSNVAPELQRDECYVRNARASRNLDACLQIKLESFRFPCIVEVASQSDNPSLCNVIGSSYYRDMCYSTVISKGTYDFALCSNVTAGLWHDECYMRAAIRESNETLCERMIYESAKSECHKRFQK